MPDEIHMTKTSSQQILDFGQQCMIFFYFILFAFNLLWTNEPILKQSWLHAHSTCLVTYLKVIFTVFLSGFSAFLRSEMKFSKLLVQPPHHLVTCAHHKSSFSFFWTSCDCFGTFMQLIMYICLRFPTLSAANSMLLKMYYIVLCAIVLPLKTSSHAWIWLADERSVCNYFQGNARWT